MRLKFQQYILIPCIFLLLYGLWEPWPAFLFGTFLGERVIAHHFSLCNEHSHYSARAEISRLWTVADLTVLLHQGKSIVYGKTIFKIPLQNMQER